MSKIAVVSVAGSAVLRPNQRGLLNEQIRNSDETCRAILPILEHGYELVLVHGSMPQVEHALVQVEESTNRIPPVTLDVSIAQVQGSLGYLLEQAMSRQLQQRGIPKRVTSIITQVVVDPLDPAFRTPGKVIGPYLTEYRAQELMRRAHCSLVEEAGKGYRKMVPSPIPREIIPIESIRRLVADGCLVIAAGGGGIPVVRDDHGNLVGIEAMVDEELAAGMLATDVGADFLVILTDMDRIFLHHGTSNQQPLVDISSDEARNYLTQGSFATDLAGAKIQAAIDFIDRGGREVLITSTRKLQSALMGRTGTRIYHDSRRQDSAQLQKRLPFSQDGASS
jgi:carbamate kinase